MKSLTVNNELHEYGIEIIRSTHPEFDLVVKEYFGEDPELISYIEWIKPLALFLKNSSSAHISAVSIDWNFPEQDGKRTSSAETAINFSLICIRSTISPERVKSYSLIASQDVKFYSFIQIPIDLMRKSHVYKNSNGGSYTCSISSVKERFLDYPEKVLFTVDGVLFSDRRFVGQNKNFLFERITGTLKGERDFTRKIKKLKDDGMSYGEIILKAQAEPDRKTRHFYMPPPRSARAAFDNSYSQKILSMRETIFRQKEHTQLSDEKIVNTTLEGLEKADFKIYKADV